jgi:hypothetical protein
VKGGHREIAPELVVSDCESPSQQIFDAVCDPVNEIDESHRAVFWKVDLDHYRHRRDHDVFCGATLLPCRHFFCVAFCGHRLCCPTFPAVGADAHRGLRDVFL